jgi:chemotaxis protein histidine kinase CheA
MGERARLLRGSFKIHSKLGRGTRVEAAIPLPLAMVQNHEEATGRSS